LGIFLWFPVFISALKMNFGFMMAIKEGDVSCLTFLLSLGSFGALFRIIECFFVENG
jgi:hypothetical protein